MKFNDLKKEGESLSNDGARVGFYKSKLKELNGEEKTKLREELISLIRQLGCVKLGDDPLEYHITYDAFGHGLEPIYFWVLDFMRGSAPAGLGLEVNKIDEGFEATASSSFTGEMGQRTAILQDRAMKMMEMVNTVIRSIVNLIYDLKEFEMRLENYKILKDKDASKSKKDAADIGLRSIWMDQVDIKRGRGSINSLAQQLEFVTLRDAFFYVKDETLKGPDGKKVDLNERVKRILQHRMLEYISWKESSGIELQKRYDVEKNYLKTQVDALRLYTQWAKPYLKTAQKLGMKEFTTKAGLPSPDLVAAFNNMIMNLKLLGKKEIKAGSINTAYEKTEVGKKYFACLEVEFEYRTLPKIMGQGQYVQTGVIDVYFRPFIFTDSDLEEIETYEAVKDLELIHNLTDKSLASLQEDLDHYLSEDKEEEKEEKKKFEWPFGNVFKGFESHIKDPMKEAGSGFFGTFKPKIGDNVGFVEGQVKKGAEEKALGNCVVIYDVFKKAHRMVTW